MTMATRWPAFTDASCEDVTDPISVEVTLHDSSGAVHLLAVHCSDVPEISRAVERWLDIHGFDMGVSDWRPLS